MNLRSDRFKPSRAGIINLWDYADEEFVFGQHKTWQTRIADIERRAALSFGRLSALDPFEGDEDGVTRPLTDPSQIRFDRG